MQILNFVEQQGCMSGEVDIKKLNLAKAELEVKALFRAEQIFQKESKLLLHNKTMV